MTDLVNKYVVPDVMAYQSEIADLIAKKKSIGATSSKAEEKLLANISKLSDEVSDKLAALENVTVEVKAISDPQTQATAYHDKVLSAMTQLRACIDELELIVSKKQWSLPTYAEMLYSVNE